MAIAGGRRNAATGGIVIPLVTPELLRQLARRRPVIEGYMAKGEHCYWYGCWERAAWDYVAPRPDALILAESCYVAILGLN